MARTALTYTLLPGSQSPLYLGKIEFDHDLVAKNRNSYLQNRQRHSVQIDRIEPENWSPNSEISPTVYVSAISEERDPGPPTERKPSGSRKLEVPRRQRGR